MAHGLDLAGSDGGFQRGGCEILWPMAWTMLGGMVVWARRARYLMVYGAASMGSHDLWPGPCESKRWPLARRPWDLMARGLDLVTARIGPWRGVRGISWGMAWALKTWILVVFA